MTTVSAAAESAALTAAADELFPQLDPQLLRRFVDGFDGDPDRLTAAVVDRAAAVVRALAGTEPVRPGENVLVVASTLSVHGRSRGVHERTARAVAQFREYRSLAAPYASHDRDWAMGVLPAIVVAIGPHYRADRTQLLDLLVRSIGVREALPRSGSALPAFLLDLVVPAAVMVQIAMSRPAGDDVAAVAAVFDRGDAAVAGFRDSGAPPPLLDTGVPVLGGADFFLRVAAYRMALGSVRDDAARDDTARDDGNEVIARTAREIAEALGRAMRGPIGFLGRRAVAEPDVMAGIDQLAHELGTAAGGEREGRLVRIAYTLLTRGLRLPRPAPEAMSVEPAVVGADDGVPEVDHIIRCLVAALFDGADAPTTDRLLGWLADRPARPSQDDLPVLVDRFRVAAFRLAASRDIAPVRPLGVSDRDHRAIVSRLVRAVGRLELTGGPVVDARRVMHLGLPPLWNRRQAAAELLTGYLVAECGVDAAAAGVVAHAGARGPVQGVRCRTGEPAAPCCTEAEGRPDRSPVDDHEICVHRPWAEIGWVENYTTLGSAAGISADAARKHVERYRGKHLALLLEVRRSLDVDGCRS